ncbi:hypothetical protein LJK87_09780 [Paenibacillus sp. P25]|nr:hypothetical protein LJK87_09780 [Paenibacillus sp. P25]
MDEGRSDSYRMRWYFKALGTRKIIEFVLLIIFVLFFLGPSLNLAVLAFSGQWNYPDLLAAYLVTQMVEIRTAAGGHCEIDRAFLYHRVDRDGVSHRPLYPGDLCFCPDPLSAQPVLSVFLSAYPCFSENGALRFDRGAVL